LSTYSPRRKMGMGRMLGGISVGRLRIASRAARRSHVVRAERNAILKP